MIKPPEDIIQFRREKQHYREHIERVRHVAPTIDTSTPKSLGLKHLETRAKKKQVNNIVYFYDK
jgi:hypothetical protein